MAHPLGFPSSPSGFDGFLTIPRPFKTFSFSGGRSRAAMILQVKPSCGCEKFDAFVKLGLKQIGPFVTLMLEGHRKKEQIPDAAASHDLSVIFFGGRRAHGEEAYFISKRSTSHGCRTIRLLSSGDLAAGTRSVHGDAGRRPQPG